MSGGKKVAPGRFSFVALAFPSSQSLFPRLPLTTMRFAAVVIFAVAVGLANAGSMSNICTTLDGTSALVSILSLDGGTTCSNNPTFFTYQEQPCSTTACAASGAAGISSSTTCQNSYSPPAGSSYVTLSTFASSSCTGAPQVVYGYEAGVCTALSPIGGGSAKWACSGNTITATACLDNTCSSGCQTETITVSGCQSGAIYACSPAAKAIAGVAIVAVAALLSSFMSW